MMIHYFTIYRLGFYHVTTARIQFDADML